MGVLAREIRKRLEAMFSASTAGDDVAPGSLLRTEGMMEAAVLVGEVSATQLTEQIAVCFEKTVGESLEAHFGAQWRVLFPFPQVPVLAKRAPVYPSTKD